MQSRSFALSFTGRRWTLREPDETAVRDLVRGAGISHTLARLLAARGVPLGDVADLIEPTLKRLLPEPLLLKDMHKAVARVQAAIERGEKIAVFGDYDVDGSSSSALLNDFLTAIGRRPRIYIPDRLTEGYGPSPRAMRQLHEEGASLVITVDCGTAAAHALEAARDAGLDVVVLDHHAVEHAPPAFAHVNPNQSDDTSGLGYLCAAGVTFLFVVALNRSLRDSGWYVAQGIAEPDLRGAVDLVGLATICDVVPLVGVNRAFVRTGLTRIAAGARPGLAALANVAGAAAPFTPHHLGFVLGPRINAGGRVGRCTLGAELLSAANQAQAEPLARLLDTHNRERQAIEAIILDEAMELAARQGDAPFLLVTGEGWHSGVVGIVAGRLKDRFHRPTFVAGLEGGLGRGSARSVVGVDVGAAVRAARQAGALEAGGGHAMAAGFSLMAEQLPLFRAFLTGWFAEQAISPVVPELALDVAISASGATADLIEEMARIGPFGAGNPEPVCAALDVTVAYADVVGEKHVRMKLAGPDGTKLNAIAFRSVDTALGEGLLKARGARVHVAGALRMDHWNGRARIQLLVEDAAPAGT
ncbi:MAG TPA: single-stranded-DNA-specific exonuclease RecJ [Rhizomicrobium sp.]|nr:single-stranded-DNA-specific exonuclease RecJ [Rhizomicrobium sp.]